MRNLLDYNYPTVYYLDNGTTKYEYNCIGDRFPDAYDNYLLWYENSGMYWVKKLTEEQFRYGHGVVYQHKDDEGKYYVTFVDGDYDACSIGYGYHGIIDNIDGSGCTGGRWHSDWRDIQVATRTVEVPAAGHYEIILK